MSFNNNNNAFLQKLSHLAVEVLYIVKKLICSITFKY